MFTGLIEDVGKIASLQRTKNDLRLEISTNFDTKTLILGESIAINGVCLTVTKISNGTFKVDASAETVKLTTFRQLKTSQLVHLERAMKIGARFGGHIVQGHVDAVGTVVKIRSEGRATHISIRVPSKLLPELVHKGSIAVDGVSLTINEVQNDIIRVTIIPFTEDKTCLGKYTIGHLVNIETDIVGKYISHLVRRTQGPGQIEDLLKTFGYTDRI